MQPIGRGLGEAQQQRPSAGRGHALQFGLPHNFRGVRVSHDEARRQRRLVGRRALRDGEIEPVAASGIVAPLAIGAKVGGAGLDFDDQHLAVLIDRRDVGAAAACQRKLGQA
jgi:hypothetical protein